MGRKPTETNDTTGTEPKRGKREPKRYMVVQRGPRVFEVLDTAKTRYVDDGDVEMFEVKTSHKTARLARAVCRELNEE